MNQEIDLAKIGHCTEVKFENRILVENILDPCRLTLQYIPVISSEWKLTYTISAITPKFLDQELLLKFYLLHPNNKIIKRPIQLLYFPEKPQMVTLPDLPDDLPFGFVELEYMDNLLCFDSFIITKGTQILENVTKFIQNTF